MVLLHHLERYIQGFFDLTVVVATRHRVIRLGQTGLRVSNITRTPWDYPYLSYTNTGDIDDRADHIIDVQDCQLADWQLLRVGGEYEQYLEEAKDLLRGCEKTYGVGHTRDVVKKASNRREFKTAPDQLLCIIWEEVSKRYQKLSSLQRVQYLRVVAETVTIQQIATSKVWIVQLNLSQMYTVPYGNAGLRLFGSERPSIMLTWKYETTRKWHGLGMMVAQDGNVLRSLPAPNISARAL
ncbi:hypothetical protein PENSPDRAFT_740716 [Peniophora sp. CONT]|nr:hypothetical protein PENSPDRAFT_740716 [Peniophora sp. CONT]